MFRKRVQFCYLHKEISDLQVGGNMNWMNPPNVNVVNMNESKFEAHYHGQRRQDQ